MTISGSVDEDRKRMEMLTGLAAGALTGAAEICITYPIKYIKTQLQLEEKLGKAKTYSGMFDCFRKTISQRGWLGVYRGLNIFFYGPKAAVRFGTFEMLKARFADESGVLSPSNRFLCGVCAGAIEAALVNTPLETIECKLIHDLRLPQPRFRGFIHGARLILQEDGWRGIYSGLYPSVLKQASNQGIRFFVMETCKNMYRRENPEKPIPKLLIAAFGGLAGACSVFGNNPIDVVKTRMQGMHHTKYKSMADCFLMIWKNEGFLSFYRGITPRLSRVCLEVALTFTIYDVIHEAMTKV